MSVWQGESTFSLETPRGWLWLDVRVAAGQTHSKLLRSAASSHSTLFVTTTNVLTMTAFVTQICMSLPNESGLFLLPGLSRVKERLHKITPGLWLQQLHFLSALSSYLAASSLT